MNTKGVIVDHATIQRWVYKFVPLLKAGMKKRKDRMGRVGEWTRLILRLKGNG